MNPKKILSLAAVGAGAAAIGLCLQYVLAASAWSPAPPSPPAGNVAAPINTGGGTLVDIYAQIKTGLLALANLAVINMNVASGTVSTAGSVLMNDGQGDASWASESTIPTGAIMALNSGTCPTGWSAFTSGAGRIIIGAGTFIVPTPPSSGGTITFGPPTTATLTQGSIGGYESVTLTTAELPTFRLETTFPIPTLAGGGSVTGGVHSSAHGGSNTSGYSNYMGSGQAIPIISPYVAESYCVKE